MGSTTIVNTVTARLELFAVSRWGSASGGLELNNRIVRDGVDVLRNYPLLNPYKQATVNGLVEASKWCRSPESMCQIELQETQCFNLGPT